MKTARTERVNAICSYLPRVEKFADVGCDHGYCTQYMLRSGLCETAYVSDISAGSLSKAEKLLRQEIRAGRCFAVCADGMKGLPPDCDGLLVAGLGGAEIVRILREGYLPEKFVLQPMKNAGQVRAFLLERGCGITADFTFYAEGKFYDLIAGNHTGGSVYSDWEIRFGRDNLLKRPPAFLQKLKEEQKKLRSYLSSREMRKESRDDVRGRLYEIEVILDAVEGDL